jgi:hypothetical protein
MDRLDIEVVKPRQDFQRSVILKEGRNEFRSIQKSEELYMCDDAQSTEHPQGFIDILDVAGELDNLKLF